MESQDDFAALMQRVRDGSEDAVKELLEQYGHHIVRIVRRRLDEKMRRKFDSEDFVQSVWASFFAVRTRTEGFTDPKALVDYLAKTARSKMIDAYRQRQRAGKWNVKRECSLDGSGALEAQRVTGKQPRPSQVAAAEERWNQLLDKLPIPQRRILQLLRQGYTRREIADRVGVDEKTIRRLLFRVAPEFLPDA